jgi:hypothetical protein
MSELSEGANVTDQDHTNSRAAESSFARLPNYPINPFQISDALCQECERPRPHTRSYPVLHLVFLISGVYARIDHVVKCPACMRAYLCQRIFLSLLLANLLSPIVLIWWIVLFIRTFSRWSETE